MVKQCLMALEMVIIISLLILVSGCQGSSSDQASVDQNTPSVQNDQSAAATEMNSDDGGDEGGARIFFPEIEHDFGNVGRNANLTHTFKVLNKGDAPLKLIKAKGS